MNAANKEKLSPSQWIFSAKSALSVALVSHLSTSSGRQSIRLVVCQRLVWFLMLGAGVCQGIFLFKSSVLRQILGKDRPRRSELSHI